MNIAWFNPLRWALEFLSYVRKDRRRKALFSGAQVTYRGETFRIVWDGPLADVSELPPPRTVEPDFLNVIMASIARLCAAQGITAKLDIEDSPKSIMAYETDGDCAWKRKLRGSDPDWRYYLKIFIP